MSTSRVPAVSLKTRWSVDSVTKVRPREKTVVHRPGDEVGLGSPTPMMWMPSRSSRPQTVHRCSTGTLWSSLSLAGILTVPLPQLAKFGFLLMSDCVCRVFPRFWEPKQNVQLLKRTGYLCIKEYSVLVVNNFFFNTVQNIIIKFECKTALLSYFFNIFYWCKFSW